MYKPTENEELIEFMKLIKDNLVEIAFKINHHSCMINDLPQNLSYLQDKEEYTYDDLISIYQNLSYYVTIYDIAWAPK